MTEMADANWFALTGLLFTACGLLLLAKAAIGDATRLIDEAGAWRRACQQRIDGLMSVPFLAVGMVVLMVAQFHHGQFGAPMVLLALSAAFGLILYSGLEGLFVDRLLEQRDEKEQARRALLKAASAKPTTIPQEPRPPLQIAHAS